MWPRPDLKPQFTLATEQGSSALVNSADSRVQGSSASLLKLMYIDLDLVLLYCSARTARGILTGAVSDIISVGDGALSLQCSLSKLLCGSLLACVQSWTQSPTVGVFLLLSCVLRKHIRTHSLDCATIYNQMPDWMTVLCYISVKPVSQVYIWFCVCVFVWEKERGGRTLMTNLHTHTKCLKLSHSTH